MTRVVVSMFLSLDGLTVGPKEDMDWVTANFDIEGMVLDMSRITASADAFLLGCQTYQIRRSPGRTRRRRPLHVLT